MKRKRGDMILLLSALVLSCIGVLMISSSSYVMASENWGDRYYYIKRHLIYLGLALVAYGTVASLSLNRLRALATPTLIVAIALLLLTLLSPLGSMGGGASRWLKLAGLRFQPSEFARLASILFLAHYACTKGEELRNFKRGLLLPLSLIAAIALLILCEPDFGTAVSVGLTGMMVLYCGGARLKHLLPCGLAALPVLVYALMGSAYRRERLMTFLDPWKDPFDNGFQIIQSFIAMRSGGFLGQGIGDGVQKFFYLPEAHTDFVFAIIGEELGFIGIAAVIILFLILVARGLLIAVRAEDRFQAILAAGLSFALGVQAATNMGVVLGLLPTKGLTLPLLSFGGSSIIATFITLGLLQSIARSANLTSPNSMRVA